MPELPEVETIKRDLEKLVLGLKITQVIIHDVRVIQNQIKGKFEDELKGLTIVKITRRAKAMVIQFNHHRYLVVHLKMTGQMIYGEDLKQTQKLKETKVVFKLSNGKYLNYNDQRLFGRLILTDDLQKVAYLNKLGPEPLEKEFASSWLIATVKELSKRRKTAIKVQLLDQTFIAGIGNIYASEILFDAKVDPQKRLHRLNQDELTRIHRSTVKVLNAAVKQRGTSMRNYRDSAGEKGNFMKTIKVYGRENEGCFNCKSLIQRISQAQRSTFYCAACQR